MNHFRLFFVLFPAIISHFLIAGWACLLFAYPLEFRDSSGNRAIIKKEPSRVVSLVPGITETIMEIGAADALKGITWHSTNRPGSSRMKVVGGFFSPNPERIEEIGPDLIFYSSLQKDILERLDCRGINIINLEPSSLHQSYGNILLLGEIFNRPREAEGILKKISEQLELIQKKVEKIPMDRRKRVIRVMGLNKDLLMTPGDDSFQNEMIRAAGGIPPLMGEKGQIVSMTLTEWTKFNPQVIYGCDGYTAGIAGFLNQTGWKSVDAVRNNNIFDFPCDLTCRAATHTGDFVAWLSASIYLSEFSTPGARVNQDQVIGSRSLALPLSYVKDSRIEQSLINDFTNKSLILDLKRPLSCLSTLEGYRTGIETVINHFASPPGWVVNHNLDMPALKRLIYPVLDRTAEKTSSLFTGADMDHISVKKQQYREMEVYALVTAGVRSNALRMSKDAGTYYEPGTINIIILPNMHLTSRAMTRAIISVTEAKSAALMDMDIRSSCTPMIHQATGTGTDNIIILEGEGPDIDNSGGHTKMGELIAKAVYEGVREAIYKQNGITGGRDVFQRLIDRKINITGLISLENCDCGITKGFLAKEFEALLLDPYYDSFVKASFALSDDYEKGLISNLEAHDFWCRGMAEEIAGSKIEEIMVFIEDESIPVVLRMSLNALLNGLYYKVRQ